jgi:acetylornithine/succinyldiaminopimelate/putrescine aminotransferase
MGEYFTSRLTQMEFEHSAKARVKALAVGLEFDDEDYPSQIEKKCRRSGLLVNADDDTLMMFPPLNPFVKPYDGWPNRDSAQRS